MATAARKPIELLLASQERAYHFALRLCGNAHDAEDVVQNAYAKLMAKKALPGGEGELRACLMCAVRDEALDLQRAQARRSRRERVMAEERPTVNPDRDPGQQELREAVYAMLGRLDERTRAVICLHYEQSLPYAEIEGILHEPANALRSYASRGIQKMQELLRGAGHPVAPAVVLGFLQSGENVAVPATLAAALAKITAGAGMAKAASAGGIAAAKAGAAKGGSSLGLGLLVAGTVAAVAGGLAWTNMQATSKAAPKPPPVEAPALAEAPQPDFFRVTTRSELDEALQKVAGGETIRLADGYYGELVVQERRFQKAVVLEAESRHGACFRRIALNACAFWSLRGLDIGPLHGPGERAESAVGLGGTDLALEDSRVRFAESSRDWTKSDWNAKAGAGISLKGERIQLRGNRIENVTHGIWSEADRVTAIGNRIENFCIDGITALGHDSLWEGNIVLNAHDAGTKSNGGFRAWTNPQQGVNELRGVIVRGNAFINYTDPAQPLRASMQGIGCFDGPYVDWVFENNIVVTDHWHGLTVLGARNVRIVNNSVFDPRPGEPGPAWIKLDHHKDGRRSSGCVVRNNIAASFEVANGAGAQDHNLVLGNAARLFKDPKVLDLRLHEDSPARNAGSAEGAPGRDYLGNPRTAGKPIDTGALQYDKTGEHAAKPVPGLAGHAAQYFDAPPSRLRRPMGQESKQHRTKESR